MATFELRVSDVFRLSGRPWVVVTGMVLQGSVRPGAQLRDVATGQTFELMGIDLVCPRPPRAQHDIALLVAPAAAEFAAPGRMWVSGPAERPE